LKSIVRGYTLLEVVMTCIISSVLAAIAIPSYMSWISSQQVHLQSEKLINFLQYSRNYAMSHHCDVTVAPVDHNWSGAINLTMQNKIIKRLNSVDGIRCVWHCNFGHDKELVFTAFGATNGQQGSFILAKNNSDAKIVIFHSGAIRSSGEGSLSA
jgi:prepilin-type N-terminal cleavage/methylation domain-containing protein